MSIKTIFIVVLSLILGGCAIARPGQQSLSTAGVSHSIEAASQSAGAARVSIRTASQAIRLLSATASATQKPAVAKIRQALSEADTHVSGVSERLAESTARATTLQTRIEHLAQDLVGAQEAASSARVGIRYWRGAALKLGILCIALTFWLFRRPIAALMGVPLR